MSDPIVVTEPLGPQVIEARLLDQIKSLVARLQQAERERDEALEGLRALSDNLTEVHKDPRYTAVWTHYQQHGGNYQGPFYDGTLQRATEIIARHAGKIVAVLAFLVLTGCATQNVPTCTCTDYSDHWSVTK